MHFLVTRKQARRGFFVLVLLALSIVLARPICEVYQHRDNPAKSGLVAAGHSAGETWHQEDPEPCCASIEARSLAAPASAVAPAIKSPVTVPLASAWLMWRTAAFSPPAPLPPNGLPFLQSYYARSARILI